MSRTLLLQFLLDDGASMLREVGVDADPFIFHICLITLCGCFLGCLFLRCLCMSNPLNGHLIICPWIWKQTFPDPTCSTAFVVLRNGLPRRRGTSSLRPMSRTTKFVGMYVSWILTKISLANPSGCHEVWSTICSLKIYSGQRSTQNLIIYYLGHNADACSKVAEGLVEDMWA